MSNVTVISLGGSIVAPREADVPFLNQFREAVNTYLDEDRDRKLIFVVGGGGPARSYQRAYRELTENQAEAEQQDRIGIAATRLNGELIRGLFLKRCPSPLVTNPHEVPVFSGSIIVAAGWKPGFSTDNDAVILAERFSADTVINLSNISRVYTADPKEDPEAVPLDRVSWEEFRKLVGETWVPGKNIPFDPVATRRAAGLHLKVITAAGRDIDNLNALLRGKPFTGTVIGPD